MLEGYVSQAGKRSSEARLEVPSPPSWAGEQPPAVESVRSVFGLSDFEKWLLLLCAAVDLDGEVARLCSQAQGGSGGAQYPTFGLALAVLPRPHWSALLPASPLRRFLLIQVSSQSSVPLTASPLKAEERILHFLTGMSYFEPELSGMIKPVRESPAIVDSQETTASRITLAWKSTSNKLPLIQLWGQDEDSKLSIAKSSCAQVGLTLWQMHAEVIPSRRDEAEHLSSLWTREAALLGSGLYVSAEDAEPSTQKTVQRFVEGVPGPAFLGVREPWGALDLDTLSVEVKKPDRREQEELWRHLLATASSSLGERELASLVGQFDLNTSSIRQVVDGAVLAAKEGGDLYKGLWEAGRSVSRPRLGELAQQIVPKAAMDDLILPEREKRLLRELSLHVAQRYTVYGAWGFEEKMSRGLGITALFTGGPGTGKTTAAEALASELRLDLFKIDLATVVSKYIGETEKNLRKVFDAAEQGGAILFFDEADALFGKRSEVKDSHDRFANIEISYLLQRMESYRGLAILATNMKTVLDPAFVRRLMFIVDFPFPDERSRAEIWRRIFPSTTPTSGLDVGRLARLTISGGNIKNIALYASFLAAGEGAPVGMNHLKRATEVEYDKLERPLVRSELGE